MKQKQIKQFLKENNITKYHIKSDLSIDVFEDVDIITTIESLDVQFNEIYGDFHIQNRRLKTLKGCPKIVKGDFNCSLNSLTDFTGGPEIVNGNYCAEHSEIKSLKGLPEIINGSLILNNNQIESLDFISKEIKNSLHIKRNKLTSISNLTNVYFEINLYGNNIQRLSIKDIEHLKPSTILHLDLNTNFESDFLNTTMLYPFYANTLDIIPSTEIKIKTKELLAILLYQELKKKKLPQKNNINLLNKI